MSIHNERYYTYKELRSIAKERGIRTRFNVSRGELCEILDVSLGDRSVRYHGRLNRRAIRLLNIKTGVSLIFPSVTRVLSVLGILGGWSVVKNRICKQKVTTISKEIHYQHGSTYTVVPCGYYTLHYMDEE